MSTAAPAVGRYVIEGVIAHGGQATVYRARHRALDRAVALKVFHEGAWADPAARRRFVRECRALAALEHPNIVPVLDAGEDAGRAYLAMRLARGGSLADRLAAGPLAQADAVAVLAQVARALDAAHAAGHLHRDVKPGNVLLEPDGHAWLADFGVATRKDATALTGDGRIIGTAGYVAPEVVLGMPATSAADRYGLAAVAFEALVGRPPFRGESPAALLYAHAHRPAPRASAARPDLPRAVDRVLAAGLAKDPDRRPASAGALVAGIERALAPGGPGRRRRGRRRTAALVAAAATLGAGGIATVAVMRLDEPAAPAAAVRHPPPARPEVPGPDGAPLPSGPAASADLPGLPAGGGAAGWAGSTRVAVLPGRPSLSARAALQAAAARLAADGLVLVPDAVDGRPIALLAISPLDLTGTGVGWALARLRVPGGEVAVLAHGRAGGVARYAEALASARPGRLMVP